MSLGTSSILRILSLSFSLVAYIAIVGGCRNGGTPSNSEVEGAVLHKIVGCDNPRRTLDVIFVHGVDGDFKSTWSSGGGEDKYWPRWLGEDFPEFGVWSLAYPVASTVWRGNTMPLIDRARNVLLLLEAQGFANDNTRPLVFISHSFGGLVTKQVLRSATDSTTDEWRTIGNRAKGVVFIATPNSGTDLANFVKYLVGSLTTVTADELKDSEPRLLDLNRWYRNFAPRHDVKTLVFFEKYTTHGFLVVSEASADPGIAGIEPYPLDRNHVNICKMATKDEPLYRRVSQFLANSILLERGPDETPDPISEMPEGCAHKPSPDEVAIQPHTLPHNVVLTYVNETREPIRLALYDWSRHHANKRGRWRYFVPPPSGQRKRFEDFVDDSTGWFSFYVVSPGGEYSPCLGTANLFASSSPRITIKGGNGRYTVDID